MKQARRFDLIAFDWDGTLFDSTALIARCLQEACRDIGVTVPNDADAAYGIGLGFQDAMKHAVPDLPPERYPELGKRYRHHFQARQDDLVLFPGTLDMLQALRSRNHWLAVATGKRREGLDRSLTQMQVGSLFHATRTADETASKPHPKMLLELMAEFGVQPERTLMIGDTTHDLQLALNAGAHRVGVSFGAHAHENFEPYAPLFVAHSTRELQDWLLTHA